MSYLLLVLPLAIGGGRGPAIVASVLAFLTFDWFFVKPFGTLVAYDPEEWLGLGLLLAVGVSTGSLAASLRRSAAEARRRAGEISTLYGLSIAIMADANLDRVLGIVVDRLATALSLPAASIWIARSDAELSLSACTDSAAEVHDLIVQDGGPRRAFDAFFEHPPTTSQRMTGPVQTIGRGEELRGAYLPFALNGRPLGAVAVYTALADPPLADEGWRVLDAFASQAALAVGRVRLVEEEERTRAAVESDRLKSVFLASISHDLRTPLTAIKTAVALLRSEPEPEARSEAAAGIDREADRLNHLVGNLLEISRIEAGSAAPQRMLEDVAELVGAAAERMAPLLDGHCLNLSASEDLPLVPLDAVAIERVITNLIDNAIKFSPPASPIGVAVSMEDGSVLIRTHNIGPPIPPAEQQRVFDKFYRLQRGSADSGGTGLGLAICKGIVEAHAGRIWTRNEDGGVAFYVALPIAAHDAAASPSPQEVAS